MWMSIEPGISAAGGVTTSRLSVLHTPVTSAPKYLASFTAKGLVVTQ
jgi:hypothetical protein